MVHLVLVLLSSTFRHCSSPVFYQTFCLFCKIYWFELIRSVDSTAGFCVATSSKQQLVMSSSSDSTFIVQKKRRRSSLYVDRPANLINDSADAVPISNSDKSEGLLLNYITQLKSCKRSWVVLEKKLKSQLNSTTFFKNQCREYEDVRNNFMDYLDVEDRTFMEEVSPLLEGSYEKQIDAIKERIQLLRDVYREDKLHCSLLFKNSVRAYRHCLVHKLNEYGDRGEIKLDDLNDICVSSNAPPILDCNSDLSDVEE